MGFYKQMIAKQKESACNAGDTEDAGSVPELGSSPGRGNSNPLQYHASWKIPWTEEPGGLQAKWLQKSEMTEHMAHLYIYKQIRKEYCMNSIICQSTHEK